MSGCERYFEVRDDYLDGELVPAEAALVRDHLDACASCRQLEQTDRRLKRVVRRHRRLGASGFLANRVRRALRRERGTRPRRWGLRMRPVAVAAAAVLLAAGASVLLHTLVLARPVTPRALAVRLVRTHLALLDSKEPFIERAASDPITLERWFRRQAEVELTLPRFLPADARLLGGSRATVWGYDGVVAFYTHGRTGAVFTLFALETGGIAMDALDTVRISGRPFRRLWSERFSLIFWQERGLTYSLVSEGGLAGWIN